MKKITFLLILAVSSFTLSAQISNTANTIYLDEPTNSVCTPPPAGNYTISIWYFDVTGSGYTSTTEYPVNVSYSGATLVLTLTMGNASLPTIAVDEFDLSETSGHLSIDGSFSAYFDMSQYNCQPLGLQFDNQAHKNVVVENKSSVYFKKGKANFRTAFY